MTKIFTSFSKLIGLFIGMFFLAGCVKDNCTQTYSYFMPVYRTSAEVRANIKSNQPREIERPGKLFIKDNYIFLNEIDKGIHIIDNVNPSAPKNVAFIDIPGNMDLAVKGNILYADLYTDLLTIDITNPLKVVVKSIIDNAFPYRHYSGSFSADKQMIIVDWEKRDTTVSVDCKGGRMSIWNCSNCMVFDAALANSGGSSQKSTSPFGMGGSMARFTIVNSHLYTVSDQSLDVFSISNPQTPAFTSKLQLGWGIETIYPFKNKLFIGSNTGMFIYDITNPSQPSKQGSFTHVRTCDPVIADDKYAYITLRSGSTCQGFTNQLDVLNIEDIFHPTLVKSYPMTNPHGLSKDGDLLFICDGKQGLKVYNATNANSISLIKQIIGPETYDVIAWNDVAIVSAADGLYQYNYSDVNNIKLLSKTVWKK
ncbi:MAG: hypothetical protein H7122_03040 [Chitinophagaceae bacterium]|nr:hypothetical protein [Chitinophagaceae bacterium]